MLGFILVGLGLAGAAEHQEVQVLRFESGLRVAVHPHAHAGTVSTAMTVGSGQLADGVGAEGSAHLVEHLWFRSGSGADVGAQLGAAGCDHGAWTYEAHTVYVTRCPSERLELLLDLEARRLSNPLEGVSAAEVLLEQQVVAIEEAERAEDPDLALRTAVIDAVYGDGHPTVERLRRGGGIGSIEAAHAVVEADYVPANTTLAITGDVEMEALLPLLTAHFGPLGDGEFRKPAPPPEPRRVMRLKPRVVSAAVLRPKVVVAWPIPGLDPSERSVVAWFLGRVLERTMGGLDAVTAVDCGIEVSRTLDPVFCILTLAEDADASRVASRLQELVRAFRSVPIEDIMTVLAERTPVDPVDAHAIEDQSGPSPGSEAAQLATPLYYFDRVLDLSARRAVIERAGERLVDSVRAWMDPSLAVVMTVKPRPLGVEPLSVPQAEPLDRGEPPVFEPVAVRTLDLTVSQEQGIEVVRVRQPGAAISVAALYLPAPEPLSELEQWVGRGSHALGTAPRGVVTIPRVDGEILITDALPDQLEQAVASVLSAAGEGRGPDPAWSTSGLADLEDQQQLPLGAARLLVEGGPQELEARRSLQAAVQALSRRRLGPGARLVVVGPDPELDDLEVPAPARTVMRKVVPDREPARREAVHGRATLSAVLWRCGLDQADPLQRRVLASDLETWLWDELRTRRGMVYTPDVTLEGSDLTVWLRVPPARTDESLELLEAWRVAAPARFDAATRRARSRLDPSRLPSIELALTLAPGDLGDPATLTDRLSALAELEPPPPCATPAVGIARAEETP